MSTSLTDRIRSIDVQLAASKDALVGDTRVRVWKRENPHPITIIVIVSIIFIVLWNLSYHADMGKWEGVWITDESGEKMRSNVSHYYGIVNFKHSNGDLLIGKLLDNRRIRLLNYDMIMIDDNTIAIISDSKVVKLRRER